MKGRKGNSKQKTMKGKYQGAGEIPMASSDKYLGNSKGGSRKK